MAQAVPTPGYAAAGTAGGVPPLLFLHGIGGNRDSFADEIAHFGKSRRALAWDMPGYGASPPIEPFTFETLAESVVALLDAEKAERAILVGHSLGGMIAQETVARFPGRVAGLVLYATTPAFGGRDDSFKRQFYAQRLAPLDAGKTMPEIAGDLTANLFGPGETEALRRRAIASMAAIPASSYRAALRCIIDFNRIDNLPRIACPTLALAAEHDPLAPPKTMQRMAERIPGARFHCLAGVGHLANFEDPAAFIAAINAFLATTA